MKLEKTYKGQKSSEGIAIGRITLKQGIPYEYVPANDYSSSEEVITAKNAFISVRDSIEDLLKQHIDSQDEVKEIFESQIMILDDPGLVNSITDLIIKEQKNAVSAIKKVLSFYSDSIKQLDDPYLKSRAKDIDDIQLLLIQSIMGLSNQFENLQKDSIIIAEDLNITEIAQISKNRITGICLTKGGVNSHISILARTYNIPCLISCNTSILSLDKGSELIIDGMDGVIYANPNAETKVTFKRKQKSLNIESAILKKEAAHKIMTDDGIPIHVFANLGHHLETDIALQNGMDGIGLYRTELQFSDCKVSPSFEDQFNTYQSIYQKIEDKEFTIRLFDIGSDKPIFHFNDSDEVNPALGVRGIRLLLNNVEELLIPQLKSIIKLNTNGKIRILVPMVSNVSEIKQLQKIINKVYYELNKNNLTGFKRPSLGIMIETPAALIMAPQLLYEVDFISIGTNDLSQYIMAADRENSNLNHLTNGIQPAVLHAIKMLSNQAKLMNKEISICGELASHIPGALLFVGLGIDKLSMNPSSIPKIKKLIPQFEMRFLKNLSQKALKLDTADEIHDLINQINYKI